MSASDYEDIAESNPTFQISIEGGIVADVLRLLMGNSWLFDANDDVIVKSVTLNGEKLDPAKVHISGGLMPAEPGRTAYGWFEMFVKDASTPRFVRKYGMVSWEADES